jgi:transposase
VIFLASYTTRWDTITRYEKLDTNFLALVKLAATRIWLRTYESVS